MDTPMQSFYICMIRSLQSKVDKHSKTRHTRIRCGKPDVLLARFEVKHDTVILHSHVEEKQRGQVA